MYNSQTNKQMVNTHTTAPYTKASLF